MKYHGVEIVDIDPNDAGGFWFTEYTPILRRDIRGCLWRKLGWLFKNPTWIARGYTLIKTWDILANVQDISR